MLTCNVLVIGGTGFIGGHLAARLSGLAGGGSPPLEQGTLVEPRIDPERIILTTRSVSHSGELLELPRVEVMVLDLADESELDRAIGTLGRDGIVVNLTGVLHGDRGDPYGKAFAQAHVELPRRLIAAMQRTGARRLLHMSALGADSSGPSMYLRSKGDGERLVRESGLDWTVFRPSVVFGPDDHFLNLFASLQRRAPVVPLACAHARFQPVYVLDVAQAMINAMASPATIGHAYELGGPRSYTLEELVRLAGEASGHPRPVLPLPDALARVQAAVLEHMPGGPLMSRDNLDSMSLDNVLTGPIAPELQVQPTSLEAVVGDVLGRVRTLRQQEMRGSVHRG